MEDKIFADALGSYITHYRKSFYPEMSSREFAEKSGISRTVISDIEGKKHNGNICSATLTKICNTLGLNDSFELREKVKKFMEVGDQKKNQKANENIILKKGTNLYSLFEAAKDLSDPNIEMLHNIALKLK